MKIDERIDAYFKFQEVTCKAEKIVEIEAMWGRTLPDDFKKFALTYGAVSLNTSLYNDFLETPEGERFSAGDIPEATQATFTLGTQSETRVVILTQFYLAWEIKMTYEQFTQGGLVDDVTAVIPNFLLPFASDVGGNLFLIESKEDGGRIFYWETNYEEWGTPDNNLVGLVADSFDAMIESLYVPEPPAPISDDDFLIVE